MIVKGMKDNDIIKESINFTDISRKIKEEGYIFNCKDYLKY